MRGQLSGRRDTVACIGQRTDQRFDRVDRHTAGTQERQWRAADDGRFQPNGASPAIYDRSDPTLQTCHHMRCRRRADGTGRVGRRRGQRATERAQERLRHRMCGHAHGHCLQPGCDQRRDPVARSQRQHKRQRAGPEGLSECSRRVVEHRDALCRGHVGHMHDQRVEAGPPLGGIDASHRICIARIPAKAVDRLGREGDQRTVRQQRGGCGKVLL